MPRLIIGHTTAHSAKIWVRGMAERPFANITIEGPEHREQRQVQLPEHTFWIAVEEFAGLQPDTLYKVRVTFAKEADAEEEVHWYDSFCRGSFTTFPPPDEQPKLKFLMGSCHCPFIPGSSNHIFRNLFHMAKTEGARFMLHAGDQIYFDVPKEPWGGPTLENYREEFLHTWRHDYTKCFLASLPQYMIMDDHEIKNNFANDADFGDGRTALHYRTTALQAYREFEHSHNPHSYGRDAFYYHFRCGGYPFFVMDIRSERFSQPGQSRAISDEQMQHVKEWLLQHKDEVKFLVTVVPFVTETKFRHDLWSGELFIHQKEELLHFMKEHQIHQTMILAGDMHSSGHSMLRLKTGGEDIVLHELVSSPLSQVPPGSFWFHFEDEAPRKGTHFEVDYTYSFSKEEFYGRHSNFMLIELDGRDVNYRIYRSRKEDRLEVEGEFTIDVPVRRVKKAAEVEE